MNQNHKISEEALESFINMFQTNLTLTKLMWKVDSRRTWEVSKLITRNVEIGRRKANGGSFHDLLPTKLRSQQAEPGERNPPVEAKSAYPDAASATNVSPPAPSEVQAQVEPVAETGQDTTEKSPGEDTPAKGGPQGAAQSEDCATAESPQPSGAADGEEAT